MSESKICEHGAFLVAGTFCPQCDKDELIGRLKGELEAERGRCEHFYLQVEPLRGEVKSLMEVVEAAREYLMQTDDIQILIDALANLEGKVE